MLSVANKPIMLSVVILNVVMLSVTPFQRLSKLVCFVTISHLYLSLIFSRKFGLYPSGATLVEATSLLANVRLESSYR
jgi:hypothetical protein